MYSEGSTPAWISSSMKHDTIAYDRFADALYREVSYFMCGVYTYDKRYTTSASMRIDKSNLFSVSNKHKKNPIWAFDANWDIKNGKFFKFDIITALVLRASLGFTDNFYRSGCTTPVMVSRCHTCSTVGGYMRISTPPNPLLRCERTKSFNLSVVPELFDRINETFTYYNNKSYDLWAKKNSTL